MAIKAIVDSLDGVDESLHGEYEERNGKFYLNLEGGENDEEIANLRSALDRKKREVEQLKPFKDAAEQFEGLDPKKAKDAIERLQELEEKGGDADPEEVAKLRREVADANAQLEALTGENETLKSSITQKDERLSVLSIDNAVSGLAPKLGVRPEAVEDVVLAARNVYRLEDGTPTPFSGDDVLYGKDGKPMSMEEWIPSLAKDKPHYFEGSSGSGANNNGSGGRGPMVIDRNDAVSLGRYADKIASGEAVVGDPS